MTSDDVVASLSAGASSRITARRSPPQLAEMRATGKYTVELKLKQKSAVVLDLAGGAEQLRRHLPEGDRREVPAGGEGHRVRRDRPFKLAEWKPDQYIRMVRFDDYKPRSEKPSGYGGGKIAYVDEIRWIPVPDVATRVAQMETGELDFADDLNLDAYDRLKSERRRPPDHRPSRTTGSSRSSTRRKA